MLTSLIKRTKSLVGIGESPVGSKITVMEHNCTKNLVVNHELENGTVYKNNNNLRENIYDLIKNIRDPEKPMTLEDLQVVYEDGVKVVCENSGLITVDVEFNPTVPHCSLATLIGLCMRIKLERNLLERIKLNIYIKKGAHETEDEINKQINDKERVAAAMENPNLRDMVEKCIKEDGDY